MHKLTLPLALFMPLLGAIGSWAVTKAQVEETSSQVKELRQTDKERSAKDQDIALRFQRLEMTLDQVAKSMVRVENKLGTDR